MENKVGSYLICVDCSHRIFVCHVGVLIVDSWKCEKCGGRVKEREI